MRILVISLFSLLCATAFAAEKKGTKPMAKEASKAAVKVVGSCDESASKGSCIEYAKFTGARTEADEKDVCDKLGGAWKSKKPCPTANLLGSCAQEEGEIQKWYDAGGNKGLKPADAKEACEALGGKFTTP
jgi:hypothetical protein